jgi:hypothetical protein
MKKLTAILLTTIALPSLACTYTSAESLSLRSIVDERGGYAITEEQCLQMEKRKLSIFVSGEGVVFKGVTVGWADVRLKDLTTGVTSARFHNSTHVTTEQTNQETAKRLVYEAINDAIAGLNFEAAAAEFESKQTK